MPRKTESEHLEIEARKLQALEAAFTTVQHVQHQLEVEAWEPLLIAQLGWQYRKIEDAQACLDAALRDLQHEIKLKRWELKEAQS